MGKGCAQRQGKEAGNRGKDGPGKPLMAIGGKKKRKPSIYRETRREGGRMGYARHSL